MTTAEAGAVFDLETMMKTARLLPSILGFLCGVCATGPMSALMVALHRRLPEEEKYPLPPREITETLAEKAGVEEHLAPPARTALAWLAHFGYGGAAGAIYANLNLPLAPAIRGPAFGMVVWLASYFGLLPALGILSSAEKQPIRRSGLMIAGHLLWGLLLGILLETLTSDKKRPATAFHSSPKPNQDAPTLGCEMV